MDGYDNLTSPKREPTPLDLPALDAWLAENIASVREITTERQNENGARMFVVIPNGKKKGRIVWFGPQNKDGKSWPRQFDIWHLNEDGMTVRWPQGSISRASQVSDADGYIRYLKRQIKEWGRPVS
jgi:hypothetical protein